MAQWRRFQTFKKAYHEGWPIVTIDKKGDVISKQHSQLCRMGKGGVQCRIALRFSHKICWLEFLHRCGDTYADVLLKIMLCSRFWQFLFLKTQSWGSHACKSSFLSVEWYSISLHRSVFVVTAACGVQRAIVKTSADSAGGFRTGNGHTLSWCHTTTWCYHPVWLWPPAGLWSPWQRRSPQQLEAGWWWWGFFSYNFTLFLVFHIKYSCYWRLAMASLRLLLLGL